VTPPSDASLDRDLAGVSSARDGWAARRWPAGFLARGLHAARDKVGNLRVQFALILAVAMAPAGLLAVLQALSNAADLEILQENRLREQTVAATVDERAALTSVRERLVSAARWYEISVMEGEGCDRAARQLATYDERFIRTVVFNSDGQAVCGAEEQPFPIKATSAWERFVESPRLVVGPVRDDPGSGERVMIVLVPISGPEGQLGVLGASLRVSFLERLVRQADTEAAQLDFALLDTDGTVVAISGKPTTARAWLPRDALPGSDTQERLFRAPSQDGRDMLFITSGLLGGEIWMISGETAQDWTDLMFSTRGFGVVVPVLMWLIAVAVAYVAIDRLVTQNVLYLQRLSTAYGRGALHLRATRFEGVPREIRSLAGALEAMAARLQERETRMRADVEEKHALLMEVHHRVKNNLQMISSLMNMQMRRVSSDAERHAVQILQDRIHALALVHQSLYSGGRLDRLSLDQMVADLVQHLKSSLCPPGCEVALSLHLEPMEASAETATPVALFVSEAISNAFKHSGPERRRLTLSVTLTALPEPGWFALTVENDICAKPVTPGPESGLGSRLMDGFARQIGGACVREAVGRIYRVRLHGPLTARNQGFALRRSLEAGDTEAPVSPDESG
jgi:two-component sensor histidine kinase